ncbi:uncharacterized protein SAZU_2134 [Streptomyces azureus]|uniref:Uncharacterized protein n=1 Tax=Streptomyces azureus TaxID=146537 RepID=A0A0K8PHN3_STRAJ|nr:uncharacterized protein SAZU_2134 [Streptomyces azureus]
MGAPLTTAPARAAPAALGVRATGCRTDGSSPQGQGSPALSAPALSASVPEVAPGSIAFTAAVTAASAVCPPRANPGTTRCSSRHTTRPTAAAHRRRTISPLTRVSVGEDGAIRPTGPAPDQTPDTAGCAFQ